MWYNSFVAKNNVFFFERREVDSLSTEKTTTREEWLKNQGYTPEEVKLIIEYDGYFED